MENIQKAIFSHFLLFFNVFLLIFAQNSICRGTQAPGVPIVMILSQDDPGLYSKANALQDPMFETFIRALESHQNLLVSPPVLYWLIKRADEHRGSSYDWASKLQNDYALFLTKEEGFTLIVPKERKDDMAALGINSDYLSEPLTSAASIRQRLGKPQFRHQEIQPAQLGHLFIKNSSFCHVPPKYFYIAGHGLDSIDDAKFEWGGAAIAEMQIHLLVNLLETLNLINTCSAYIVSCYSAGINAQKVQNILSGTISDERCACLDKLEYPVVIQCSGDIASCLIIEHFPQFFTTMQEWYYQDADSIDCLAQKITSQFMDSTQKMTRFANYPMIRMPKTGYFQALPLPGTIIISEPIKEEQIIEAPTEKEMVQVYPADLRQLTIHMPDEQLPAIVSRVAGRSHHFIGSITTKAFGTVDEVVNATLLNGIISAGDNEFFCGVSDKAWFVGKLTIANKDEIDGLVVFKGSLKLAKRQAIAVYRTAKNEYIRLTIPLPWTANKVQKEKIDEATYIQTVEDIYWQTMPAPDALDEATHKSENQADHDVLFIDFGKELGIGLSLPADDEMIQKDFNRIRNGQINKSKYINYAAHIHYEPLIDAIVDNGIKADIFNAYDIIILLYRLIDHEYQPLIFKQVQKLATQNDPKFLNCVLNAFDHFLDAGLHKHALQMYGELFICLKKALAHKELKKDFLSGIQEVLRRFVVILVQKDCAQNAVEKVLELLNSADLGLQVIGLILFATMENAGFTNEKLNQKRTLLHAIALNLKKAVRARNAVALYFYEQELVQQCIECLVTASN